MSVRRTAARSTRRLSAMVLVGGLGAAALTGCGMSARQSGAAVVDGQVISNEELQQTVDDLRKANPGAQITAEKILPLLIMSPTINEQAKASGTWSQAGPYQQLLAQVPDASEGAKTVALAASSSQGMTEADAKAISEKINKQDIHVNPRYGTLTRSADPREMPVSLGSDAPSWIQTPTKAAAANDAGVPTP